MKCDRLRLNQLPDDVFAWYLGYLGAMDARDLDAYGRFLADDCAMRFNNEPPTEGKTAILGRLRDYWQSFRSIERDALRRLCRPRR